MAHNRVDTSYLMNKPINGSLCEFDLQYWIKSWLMGHCRELNYRWMNGLGWLIIYMVYLNTNHEWEKQIPFVFHTFSWGYIHLKLENSTFIGLCLTPSNWNQLSYFGKNPLPHQVMTWYLTLPKQQKNEEGMSKIIPKNLSII